MNTSFDGECLCGGIRVRITAPPGPLVFCHCQQCRKTSGAPFTSVVPVAAQYFELDDPACLLREYRATPGKKRCFCRRCGAPIYSLRDGAETVRVRAGLFAALEGVGRTGHIFTANSPRWHTDNDDLPRYAGIEPGRAAPESSD